MTEIILTGKVKKVDSTKNGSIEALFWQNKEDQGQPIHDMKVIGDHLEKLQISYNSNQTRVSERDRYQRQILLFGEEGQKKIAARKVGIVGMGGLGSHVGQQLAYLGVRDFSSRFRFRRGK